MKGKAGDEAGTLQKDAAGQAKEVTLCPEDNGEPWRFKAGERCDNWHLESSLRCVWWRLWSGETKGTEFGGQKPLRKESRTQMVWLGLK